MPAHLLRTHYLLSEAVELLGERMFGNQWLGGEIFVPPVPAVEEILARRAQQESTLAEHERLLAAIDAVARSRNVHTPRAPAFDRSAIEQSVSLLRTALSAAVPLDDRYRATFEMCQRRDAVINRLLQALEWGEIHAIRPGSPARGPRGQSEGFTTISDSDWARRRRELELPKLAYLFELSILEPLDGDTFFRPMSVRIVEEEFDRWISELDPAAGFSRLESDTVKCRRWLRKQVESGQKRMPKKEYAAQARELFPTLSGLEFGRIWAIVVPPEWKRHGRPKR